MLRLLFLLMGGPALRGSWPWLLLTGFICTAASAGIVLDMLNHGTLLIPLCLLGIFLSAEGLMQAWRARVVASGGWRAKIKALSLIVLAVTLLAAPQVKGVCLAWLFAAAFIFDGGFRIISCSLMRCRRWQYKLAIGSAEWLFSLLIITDWPLPHRVIIPLGFAVLLLGWAFSLLQMAWQIRALPPNTSVAALPLFTRKGLRRPHGLDYLHSPYAGEPVSTPLTV